MSKKVKAKTKPVQNNVVLFPVEKAMTQTLTIAQIKENKELLQQIHIEETIDMVIPNLLNNIEVMGFNISSKPELVKEINLVVESVNSMLLRYYNQDHPLQETAAEVFSFAMADNEKNEED